MCERFIINRNHLKVIRSKKAIIYVLLGMTVFAIQDTFIKLILDNTNLYLIYFVRCIIGLTVIIIYLK